MKIFKWCICVLICSTTWAWNAQGHRIVVKLANTYLSPSARIYFNYIQNTRYLGGASTSISDASLWMDKFYSSKYRFLRKLHYIQIPEGDGRYFPKYEDKYNALFAIEYAKKVLSSSMTSPDEKAFAMRVLVHVIADIHQPLHTINVYSARYPHGDKGGNLIRIKKQSIAKNLHSFWDRGGGWLLGSEYEDEQKMKLISYQPCDGNPKDWIMNSHQLALTKAYRIPHTKSEWAIYTKETQKITQHQLQSAACHLAGELEQLVRAIRVARILG